MPGDPRLTSIFDEIRLIAANTMRQENIRVQVGQFTPTSAALYANYARQYPWMQPGVMRAASMAGYSPDNPDMIRLARASLGEGIDTGRITAGTRQRATFQNPGYREPTLYANDHLSSRPLSNGVTEDPFAQYAALGFIDAQGILHRPAEPDYNRETRSFEYKSDEDRNLDHKFTEFLRQISRTQDSPNKPIPYMMGDEPRQWHPKTGASEVLNTRPEVGFTDVYNPASAMGIPGLGPATRAVERAVEPVRTVATPAIRVAGMAANYGVQQVQQGARNTRLSIQDAIKNVQEDGFVSALFAPPPEGAYYGGETTDIGIAAEHLLKGEEVDTGSGFFVSPTSQVAQERVRREAQAGQIGGHNITWGRWAASAVTDPDTIPFDVLSGFIDAGVQYGDPVAAGLGQLGRNAQAAKLFEAEPETVAAARGAERVFVTGPGSAPESVFQVASGATKARTVGLLGIPGRAPAVNVPTARKLFDSEFGAKVINDITNLRSAYQIGKKMSRNQLEFRHDPALYNLLAGTTTPQETRHILEEAISTGQIREVADLTKSWGHGIAANIRPRMPRSRLMDKMPGEGVQLTDGKDVANQIMRHYRNVNAPESAMEEAFNVLSLATTKSGRRSAVLKVFGSGPNSLLAHHGVDPEVADKLTKIYKSTVDDMWRGLVDELGTEVPTWEHMLANGEKTYIGGPHALIELAEDYMPLPDGRALRELTRKFPSLLGQLGEEGAKGAIREGLELPGAAVEYFVQEIWKPLALMRGAWLVRVLGEGQMRIAADGLDSLFSGHPLEALGFMMSKPHFGIKPRIPVSFMDDPWDEIHEYDFALSKINNWAYRPGAQATTTRAQLYDKTRHTMQEFRHAWARQLMKFNYDPIYSQWMNSTTVDELTEWFTKGAGKKYLRELQEAFPGNLRTPEQVRTYFDQIEQRWRTLTSGNTDLFDILKSSHFTNAKGETVSIYRSGSRAAGNPELNPEFSRYIDQYIDDAPQRVPGRAMQATRGKSDYPALRRYAVQNFLYGSMSRAENLLARSSVFKQSYGKEMADLIQFASADARAEFIAKARELNVPNRTIKHMEHLASTMKPGHLSMAEADLIAKGRAMDRAQKLLYSYSERRQIFDITRNFFPFGDAWYEVMSTWGRLVRNTAGKPLRRAQQIIEGSINSGFFHENPFGELAFTYPFSGAISQAITGQPVQMEGRVQGLSMFGEIMPGLGPVAQIPAAWFLKDKPDLKYLEDFLLPYGGPEAVDILNYKTYFPGWLRTATSMLGLKTADDKRMWENTVAQYADYLFSSGEYGMSTSEQTRLWQDAKKGAKKIYGLRMMGQFWAPASPSLEFYVQDKSGHNLSAMALAEEFHKMSDGPDGDFETAVQQFVGKYGENALGSLVASSSTSVPGFPDSREGQAWVDNNPHIKNTYPMVYALFAPRGEFDYDTYVRQFSGPDRQALTAQQHVAMLGDWLNRYWRTEAMRRMGVNSYSDMNATQRNVWEDISVAIDTVYPNARVGIFEKPQVKDMITQLEAAAQDPAIQQTEAGPALVQYLLYRQDAQAAVDTLKERGLISQSIKGFTKAKALAPVREALRHNAQVLIDANPAFEPLWDFVFSRELAED